MENIRLLCWAHNRHAAEQTFGPGFMKEKRESGKQVAAAKKRTRAAAKQAALDVSQNESDERNGGQETPPQAPPPPETIARLRMLGLWPSDAPRDAAGTGAIRGSPA